MQNIWSRVALRGACKCPQCLHVPQGITRRKAAGGVNAVPRYWTSSTFWLSGTFATAATWDAVAKQNRREQWDAAIKQLKNELDEKLESTVETTTAPNEAGDLQMIDGRAFWRGGNVTVGDKLENSAEIETIPNEAGELQMIDGRAVWRIRNSTNAPISPPDHTGPRLSPQEVPPQSVYASEQHYVRTKTRAWSPKKLEVSMLSMDILQLTIMEDLHARTWLERAERDSPESLAPLFRLSRSELNEMRLAKIAQLKFVQQYEDGYLAGYQRPDDDIALCNYTSGSQRTTPSVVDELNAALHALFDAYLNGDLHKPALLARIAHNISLSTSAPDVNTYNILLLGFAQCHPTLIKATAQSLKSTKIRPNEVTNEMLLRYHTQASDSKLYRRMFRTLRGKAGGQCLAQSGSKLYLRVIPEKIYQLPAPTPGVFAAIIHGCLKFAGFDAAMERFKQMHEEGWGLSADGLYPALYRAALEQERLDAAIVILNYYKALLDQRSQREEHSRTNHVLSDTGLHTTSLRWHTCRQTMGWHFRGHMKPRQNNDEVDAMASLVNGMAHNTLDEHSSAISSETMSLSGLGEEYATDYFSQQVAQ